MAEYPVQGPPTSFQEIYNVFLGKITDDMYAQDDPAGWTKEDTEADLQNILLDAIPGFEFPRFPLYDYGPVPAVKIADLDDSQSISEENYPGAIINLDNETQEQVMQFNSHLTPEEINILALLMYNTWLQRQIASIEQTRMKYSGSDFKMTSQANHLAKLMDLKKEAERQAHHMQRLYKRRKIIDNKGSIKSNWSTLMEVSALDG